MPNQKKEFSSVTIETYRVLLLGFICITVITILIHGLPSWDPDSTEDGSLKTTRVSLQSETSIEQQAREAVNVINKQKRIIVISSMTNENLTVKEPGITEYIVKPGDSLWRISVKFLGDGNRYREIIELNKDIIKDAGSIPAGIHLKIPRE